MNGADNYLYVIPNSKNMVSKFQEINNLRLVFNKFLKWKKEGDEIKENRKELLKSIIKHSNQPLYTEVFQKNKNIVNNLNSKVWDYTEFELRSDWRLVVGLGEHHPFETNIRLDYLYGVPIIPASTLKGVFRAYCIFKSVNMDISKVNKKDEEIENIDDKCMLEILKEYKSNGWENLDDTKKIFLLVGNQYYAGNLIFLDAVPKERAKFKIDIMTPHFTKYYSGKNYPNDTESPVPIQFLVIEETNYSFLYILNKERLNKDLNNIKDFIKNRLSEALKEFGVGAKTSIGYGFFK